MGKARVGELQTAHGIIETPNFIPVGTQATVKAVAPDRLTSLGAQVVLANTYHLMLRPGAELIHKLGGLHSFMNWDKPIMTDSGGFQVFSLGVALEHGVGKMHREEMSGMEEVKPRLNKVTKEGVVFQSHIDGSKQLLTPESSIKTQYLLGADLIVAFDDHESSKHNYQELVKSLELTEQWELRSLAELKRLKSPQLMYGVVHGALNKELRLRSAKFTDRYFAAIAIGGIYETKRKLHQMVGWVAQVISEDKVRHLLGIGEVEDLFECINQGMDLFDCVAPTRRARNGSLYVSPKSGDYQSIKDYQVKNYVINIRSAKHRANPGPVDRNCGCFTCQNFSRRIYITCIVVEKFYFMNWPVSITCTLSSIWLGRFVTVLKGAVLKNYINPGFLKQAES